MFPTKWAIMAEAFLITSLLGTSTGALVHGIAATQATEPNQPPQDPMAAIRSLERADLVKVASPIEGVVWFIGTEIKPGDQVPPGQLISVTTGKETKTYRRLKKGDRVEKGQLLVRLDDRLAYVEYAIQKKRVEEAEAAYKQARAVQDECRARHDAEMKRVGGTTGIFVGSDQKLRDAFLQWVTAKDQAENKERALERTKLELEKAQIILHMHEIRCRTTGVIEAIAKYPGEAVKRLETVMVLRIAKR